MMESKKSKLSLEQCKRYHRELWYWLELRPGKEKWDWPGLESYVFLDIHMPHNCFACLYATDDVVFWMAKRCNRCPIQWPGGVCEFTESDQGLYEQWIDATYDYNNDPTPEKAEAVSNAARAIRLCPWKDEV